LSPLAIWRGFRRLTQIGWPRRYVIVQFPIAPLILAFVAGEIAKHTQGPSHAYASSVSYLALIIWGYLELVEGVNWFRRLLGLAYVGLYSRTPRPGIAELAAGARHPGNGCA
jgi:hypothetical protein